LYESRSSVPSGEIDLLKAESIKNAREALNKLPPKLREVLILKEYSDLNYKEIGKVMGITEGNVKVRIFRARKLLEEIIGAEDVFLPN
jgi:RNA polymerase sigma-70 factor (ECF subfamily)